MTTFTVRGTHGQLTAKVSTGAVIKYEPRTEEEPEYTGIIRFDVEEYAAAYPGENLEWIDICDIGYWTTAGDYEPAVSNFRAEIASNHVESKQGKTRIGGAFTSAANFLTAGDSPRREASLRQC